VPEAKPPESERLSVTPPTVPGPVRVPPLTRMRSLVVPSSKLRIEPVLSVRPSVKVAVPSESPGARMTPEGSMMGPEIVPEPPRV
jgi:hypothetical protein